MKKIRNPFRKIIFPYDDPNFEKLDNDTQVKGIVKWTKEVYEKDAALYKISITAFVLSIITLVIKIIIIL